jgi:hypothetical protein
VTVTFRLSPGFLNGGSRHGCNATPKALLSYGCENHPLRNHALSKRFTSRSLIEGLRKGLSAAIRSTSSSEGIIPHFMVMVAGSGTSSIVQWTTLGSLGSSVAVQ